MAEVESFAVVGDALISSIGGGGVLKRGEGNQVIME
jgi:hypothetical protein